MNLAYKISSHIKIHKVYFPNVSPITATFRLFGKYTLCIFMSEEIL